MDEQARATYVLILIIGGSLLAIAARSFAGTEARSLPLTARARNFGATIGALLLFLVLLGSCAVVSQGSSIIFSRTP